MAEEKYLTEGTVVGQERNGYWVECESHQVFCYVSGKLRKFKISIVVGDSVEVEIGAYDTSKGRITKRLK